MVISDALALTAEGASGFNELLNFCIVDMYPCDISERRKGEVGRMVMMILVVVAGRGREVRGGRGEWVISYFLKLRRKVGAICNTI